MKLLAVFVFTHAFRIPLTIPKYNEQFGISYSQFYADFAMPEKKL